MGTKRGGRSGAGGSGGGGGLLLCATTNKPATLLTPGAGGGSIVLVDGQTSSVLSSLRVAGDLAGKNPLGATTLSVFPSAFTVRNSHNVLSLAYGKTVAAGKKDDTYAMLVSLRVTSPTLPPLLHWKSRLPEGNLTAGLAVSPCGHYAVGGAASGALYVWSTLGGKLLRTIPGAHYRAVQVIRWTPDGRVLATGGADGLIHLFGRNDLVEHCAAGGGSTKQPPTSSASGFSADLRPLRTWNLHRMPVLDLAMLPDGRMVSAGQDATVAILELASEKVLATFQMPYPIQSLAVDNDEDEGSQILAGSVEGTIFILNLDGYAMYKRREEGITVVDTTRQRQKQMSMLDHVFGRPSAIQSRDGKTNNNKHNDTTEGAANSDNTPVPDASHPEDTEDVAYRSELRGHDHPITALAVYHLEENEDSRTKSTRRVASGDQTGTIRIWDLDVQVCLRTIRPWTSGNSNNSVGDSKSTPSTADSTHPVTSLQVLSTTSSPLANGDALSSFDRRSSSHAGPSGTSGGQDGTGSKRGTTLGTIVPLVTPLQQFTSQPTETTTGGAQTYRVVVPFLTRTSLLSPSHVKNSNGSSMTGTFWDVANDPIRNRLIGNRLLELQRSRKRPYSAIEYRNRNDVKGAAIQPVEDEQGCTGGATSAFGESQKIRELEAELAEAQQTIQRWQTVNNKLMDKLKRFQQT